MNYLGLFFFYSTAQNIKNSRLVEILCLERGINKKMSVNRRRSRRCRRHRRRSRRGSQ